MLIITYNYEPQTAVPANAWEKEILLGRIPHLFFIHDFDKIYGSNPIRIVPVYFRSTSPPIVFPSFSELLGALTRKWMLT